MHKTLFYLESFANIKTSRAPERVAPGLLKRKVDQNEKQTVWDKWPQVRRV